MQVRLVLSLHHPIVSSTATPSSSARTDILPPQRHHLSRIRLKKEGIAVARIYARSPEGFQGGGSAAGRAARAIDSRDPPGFLTAHLWWRCGRRVYRVFVGRLWEVVEKARRELAPLGERKVKVKVV